MSATDEQVTTSPSPRLAESLRRAALRLKTPLYVYESERLDRNAAAVAKAFPDRAWTRLFSIKANSTPGVVARLAGHGFGANAVSRGELALAARGGVAPEATALEGIGKAPLDLRAAVDLAAAGRALLWVSVESADEAASLADLAGRFLRRGRRLDVLIRINPAVTPETHAGLAVGSASSKFGVAPEEVRRVIHAGGGGRGSLRWRGLHVHAGSQLASVEAWSLAVATTLEAYADLADEQPDLDTVDVGGGFPAGLAGAPTPADFGRAARAALGAIPRRRRPARLAIEPGRALVADAGWLVARVLHVRERAAGGNGTARQVVIDAGMTELVRPALYGATHPIVALTSMGAPGDGAEASAAMVDGPICESTDRFGVVPLPPLERGDLVAIGLAGAYASTMFSSYNGRPRPPEVLLEPDGSRTVLRRRAGLGSLA